MNGFFSIFSIFEQLTETERQYYTKAFSSKTMKSRSNSESDTEFQIKKTLLWNLIVLMLNDIRAYFCLCNGIKSNIVIRNANKMLLSMS